jgi:hypothetical protein
VLPQHLPGGLRTTTENLSQDSQYPGRDMNLGPPEYEAGVLTNRLLCSVRNLTEASAVYLLKHHILVSSHFRLRSAMISSSSW